MYIHVHVHVHVHLHVHDSCKNFNYAIEAITEHYVKYDYIL